MASIREVSGFTEDLLCPICLSLFREPRVLECGHSFCATCLKACFPVGQQHGLCPECRCSFALSSVATNWALCSLAEKARLLKLDDGDLAGGGGHWYVCVEHEEPLKLFCSQDEGPICVVCQDLPQHQGHDFLPIKNAVQQYQDKLTASLAPLTDHLNSATEVQSHQQENLMELEDRKALDGALDGDDTTNGEEEEEGYDDTANGAEEEYDMGSGEEKEEEGYDDTANGDDEEGYDDMANGEEEEGYDDMANGEEEEEVYDDTANGEEKGDEDKDKDKDGDVVAVNPELKKFKDLLNFEAWQEMLRSIHAATDHDGV